MPIFYYDLRPQNAHVPTYGIAKVLAMETARLFGAVRHAGAGIGIDSCCAAFAVYPDQQIHAIENQQFGATYGNSQIAARGLDLGPLGGHAERCAITAAGNYGLTPLEPDAVLFVELEPCDGCKNWLLGNGGGVENPYDFGPTGKTLCVWYAFPYPGGVQAMHDFHNLSVEDQQNEILQW